MRGKMPCQSTGFAGRVLPWAPRRHVELVDLAVYYHPMRHEDLEGYTTCQQLPTSLTVEFYPFNDDAPHL